MTKPIIQKILEIKGSDFLQGTSSKQSFPFGGLFQEILGCDIYDDAGIAKPSLAATQVTLATTPKVLNSWNDGAGNSYVYAQSDTKLYQMLKNSPYTATDVTAQITPRTTVLGAMLWRNKYIYIPASVGTTDLRANTLPVAIGSDIQIHAGILNSSNIDTMPMCIGADGNLYIGNSPCVSKITNESGTSGNIVQGFVIDTGFTVRDMCNDGRYLVIIADNNSVASAQRQVGDYKCRVYFWDMARGTADIIYEIHGESYLIASRFVDGAVYIFGYSGFYVCNSSTPLRMIRSFLGSSTLFQTRPGNSYQVTDGRGSIYWIQNAASASLTGTIYAYGNPIAGQPKVFYQPYSNGGAGVSGTQNALTLVGEQPWNSESSGPSVYVNNSAATYSQLGLKSLDYQLPVPTRFEFAKVVLARPLSTGQTVTFHAETDQGQTPVSTGDTKSYNSTTPHRELVFNRKITSGAKDIFESLNIGIETTGGAAIARVTVYGTPQDDFYQKT